MRSSRNAIDLIKKYEGCKLKAYLCPAGIPTIGYGSTFYEDGRKVKLGDSISQKIAEDLLFNLTPKFEKIVLVKIKVPINQNQFDALVSYCWNTGGSDTLFDLINKISPSIDIKTWFETKYITADGKVLEGLVKRRKEECELYFKK